MTFTSGSTALIWRVAAMPSSPGRSRSIRTTSGRSSLASSTPSSPRAASPITLTPCPICRLMTSRNASSSSTISTFSVMPAFVSTGNHLPCSAPGGGHASVPGLALSRALALLHKLQRRGSIHNWADSENDVRGNLGLDSAETRVSGSWHDDDVTRAEVEVRLAPLVPVEPAEVEGDPLRGLSLGSEHDDP